MLQRKGIAESIRVSECSVDRWMDLPDLGKPVWLPKVLSINEFRGNAEYGELLCILTDPVCKRIAFGYRSFRDFRIQIYYTGDV